MSSLRERIALHALLEWKSLGPRGRKRRLRPLFARQSASLAFKLTWPASHRDYVDAWHVRASIDKVGMSRLPASTDCARRSRFLTRPK